MAKKISTQIIERTAPSPTGSLHLGHIYSIMTAYNNAKKNNGLFKLRIEDIDSTRCKINFEKEIISNLLWLGIRWNGKIMRQRNRKRYYTTAIEKLQKNGLVYPCSCTRSDIKNAVTAPHFGDHSNIVYPGTCKITQPKQPIRAIRLDVKKAIKITNIKKVVFVETGPTSGNVAREISMSETEIIQKFGDIIIARQDIGTSYNLSVVIDDAAQMVTHVTRGNDLLSVTPIQVLLQKLLNLPTPVYYHHDLIYEISGKKMSKRSSSQSVNYFKNVGLSPQEVIERAFKLKQN